MEDIVLPRHIIERLERRWECKIRHDVRQLDSEELRLLSLAPYAEQLGSLAQPPSASTADS
jgi:hypothetical protein